MCTACMFQWPPKPPLKKKTAQEKIRKEGTVDPVR